MTDLKTAGVAPLYSLSESYLAILDLLEQDAADTEGEQLFTALDAIAEKIALKADNIVALVKQFEMFAEMRAEEAKRMKALADADVRRAERLKAYLLKHLQAIGIEKVDTARFRLSLRTNPPAVTIVEELLVPAEYVREIVTTSVDKRKILENFNATGEIPDGCDIVRAQRLEIR